MPPAMPYAEFQEQDRRLALLQALEKSVQYRASTLLLQRYLDAVGHVVSADRLAADLAWLAEGGLVQLDVPAGSKLATLTPRGLEVATGRARHPGVTPPGPGA